MRFFSFVSDVVGAVDVDAAALDAAEASDWLAADGGERRDTGSSTCAVYGVSVEAMKGTVIRTVLQADQFIDKPLVRELC